MNVLKALAKMTKLAASLETQNIDLRRDVEVSQKRELTIGDHVAIQRAQIETLEAKLFAAEEKAKVVPPPIYTLAEKLVKSLGYSFDHTTGWTLPAQPTAPYPSVAWRAFPWATHYLYNSSLVTPAYAHAELIDGVYYGDPSDNKHGRIQYVVGPRPTDWRVLEIRPVTPAPSPPILVDHLGAVAATTIARPEGTGWRNGLTAALPRDMSCTIEAILFNGNARTARAEDMDWNESSVGVAWWRFAE